MSLIKGYKQGSNITILNATYKRPFSKMVENEFGEYSKVRTKGTMCIVYKDNDTGEKKHQIIKDPSFMYYVSLPGLEKDYTQFFVSREDVKEVKCKYRELNKSVAEQTGQIQKYNDLKEWGDYKSMIKLHNNPKLFSSDVNIEDFYRAQFARWYKNTLFPLHKAYFDIEADTIDINGDFPEMGEAPINCVSLYDEKENKVHTFILRNPKNPLIEEFEKEIQDPDGHVYKELYDLIVETVGGQSNADAYGITGVSQAFYFFDEEISMISFFFDLVHKINPDFMLAWNMGFDVPYTIQRIVNLGYNPLDIMCDKSYDEDTWEVYYYIDQRNYNEFAERTDFCNITGDTVWLDQMLQFCQKRKSKIGSFHSFRLDDIAFQMCGAHKLSYADITTSITKLPYMDFKRFVFYNVIDTVDCKCIEAVGKDIDYIMTSCLTNDTSFRKGYRQTTYLINRIRKDFYEKGFILGNNKNRFLAMDPDFKKPDKYAGAIVTRPRLTGESPRMPINGTVSMIANNVIDQDYKSLYPSCELEDNIAPNTQIGKITFKDKVYENENVAKEEKYERTGEYIENLMCQNNIEFAVRYFKYASFREFIDEDLPEYLAMIKESITPKKMINPFIEHPSGMINPFVEHPSGKINPFVELKPDTPFEELIAKVESSL